MDPFRSRIEAVLAGQYRFVRELGGGGMSRTYLADEPALQRRVVVKVLAPEMLEGLSVERFKREVLLAASLQHPHVVPVLAAGDADGLPWFSMPYVDGDSLRHRLSQGPLAIGEAVAILRDVARALSYAHTNGVVHRDIKPDNVLLSAGSATVTDFGIAKAISASRQSASSATLTQVGLAIGTPAYMAPEQAEGATNIDQRADIYAFGAMAFELLTGSQVFSAPTPGRLLIAHMTEAPRDPRVLRADIPAPLAELVLRCLSKAPDDRPADASMIVNALESVGTANASAQFSGVGAAASLPLAQVLGSWAGGAVLLVGGVFAASRTIGVPSWAMPSAITLAAAGLPALVGAWWVQRTAQRAATRTPTLTPGGSAMAPGTLATLALRAQPLVTIRRTRRLAVMAASALGVAVVGFVAMRAYGIGPAASLISAGEFGKRESVLVADFHSPASDSTLGVTVAEALRTDLAQSPNLAVLTRASVRDALLRMQRPADAPVPFDLARVIATREGTKAVIDGDVVRLGTSYVLTARLVAAVDGHELAAFRETAKDDAELVPAVGKLSRSIREKVGEPLKALADARDLERVSTPSLAALRKYVEGMRIDDVGGDATRALALMQEAVTLDSTFAMAWRKMSVMYSNLPGYYSQSVATAEKAYRFRDRLTDDERDLTDAWYFVVGPSPDPAKSIAAYERVLARDSLHFTALNNLGVLYTGQREFKKAFAVVQRAAALPRPSASPFVQLAAFAGIRRLPGLADSTAAQFARLFPGSNLGWAMTMGQLLAHQRLDSLARLSQPRVETSQDPTVVSSASDFLVGYEASRGRITSALAAGRAGHAALDRIVKRPPQLFSDVLDSATTFALYDGDKERTHTMLQRLVTPAVYATTPVFERNWLQAGKAAALVGDAAGMAGIEAERRRDIRYVSGDPVWEDASFAGYAALAKGQYKEAVTQLQRAASRHGAPSPAESFFIAMAFDRAGARDSAVAWFSRVVDPAEAGEPEAFLVSAAAHKRLAELFDAKGDAAGAITHYDAFAQAWKDAEPSRQPFVKAARDRAAQLRTKRDPG